MEDNQSQDKSEEAGIMMEEIVEKLKLLEYETLFTRVKGYHPVTRTFFSTKSQSTGEQSVHFFGLSSWLIGLCGGKISGDKKYDDPVTMANNLLTEMKNVGIESSVSPIQLRSGFGASVCTVLLQLVNKALEKKGFTFKKSKYDEDKRSGGEDGPEIEDEAPDLINIEIDYGDNINEVGKQDVEKEILSNQDGDNGTSILNSGITAEDWQRELEKVTSKLKIDYNSLNSFGNSEWRAHISTIRENEEKFTKSIPDSRAVLENLSTDIDKSLEKITKKEEMISKNHSNIIKDYKEKHKVSSNQYDEYKQLNENVELIRRELEDINDKIALSAEKYDSMSKTVSDTSALGNIKQSIQKLFNENVTMDMKIHILNHSLLKYQLECDAQKLGDQEANDVSMFQEVV